jgi:hypothetical protein
MTELRFRATTNADAIAGPSPFGPNGTVKLEWRTEPRNCRIGHCVYCRSTAGLTDEHSVPYSIWGVDRLIGASCQNCSGATQKIEDYAYRRLLAKSRELMNAPTRKAKRTGRWNGSGTLYKSDKEEEIPLPLALPLLIMPFPEYLPRSVTGRPRSQLHDRMRFSVNDLVGRGPSGSDQWTTEPYKIDHDKFLRAIAKIAYCEFIRMFDNTYVNEEVSDYIVRGVGDPSFIVGGKHGDPPDKNLHSIEHMLGRWQVPSTRTGYSLLARVRLFSFLNTPSYYVWLGDIAEAKYAISTISAPINEF